MKAAEVMHTADGNPIIHAKLVYEGGGGMRRGWIVLCDISGHNDVHPYVTWWMDVDGHTFEGEYCRTLEEAEESYGRRR